MKETGNIIIDLSFKFALDIIAFCETLEIGRKFVIANQLLRSGTSIGANVREAQNCESKADFIHKVKIAAKEAEDVEYWLELCKYSENYPFNEKLLEDIKTLQKIINKIINTSKSR
ncbi:MULTISPECIES: four helix bundle protein [unclassified Dysgonomonas]|jgi:four helix bundle protein|uniref:four helix bundle protein n=1 Tax=unclassified Dysgonomonas TaxID=2630389 RepID=UPI0025B85896|nr:MULTISPECIES: four helix bundle protein [unclassified Dysgonomonas]MDR2002637.1 four helix bundle protein [Prevotella sp.]HMM04750.1 four helix bundle protein [Dysgonomonas sp.]